MRVLVIEDQANTVELLRAILDTEGHTVVGVSEGNDAVELVGKLQPDVVTLDLNLPGHDGRDLLRLLTGLERHPPVVVISAFLDRLAPDERQLAADVVTKPFSMFRLIEVVERAARQSSARKD